MSLLFIFGLFLLLHYELTRNTLCPLSVIFLKNSAQDFAAITDHTYTQEQILAMELKLLGVIDYEVKAPIALVFLRRFSRAADSDTKTHTLSKYLLELTLPEYKMLHFLPSTIAAASVYLARRMTHQSPAWVSRKRRSSSITSKQC